ncbi:MAG TPA: hypothetical protein VGG03_08150 [Thermoanaerobaculia bacterium]|jgi:hypothetical protein
MPTLEEWWDGFWGKVRHSPTILSTRHAILPDHVDKQPGQRFKRDQQYFVVKINRIFLQYDRQFWTTYAPMALVVSEFQYDGQHTVVPFVVGPSLLENDQIELPRGFMFLDTKVAGIHPYKGGGLKLSIILYRVKRTDLAKQLLKVVENIASVLDFSQVLTTYLKIAGVLVDTVGDIIGTDQNNQPIIGLRQEFEAGDEFKPGYFALIDSDKIEQGKLWVRDNELLYGDGTNPPKFIDANYVLYSIDQVTERDDIEKLSFYDQWKTALAEAHTANPEKWLSAKANWTALYQMMSLSPDLISPQAEALAEECFTQMETKYNNVKRRAGTMGSAENEQRALGEAGELRSISEHLDRVRSKSVSVLRAK